MDEIIDMVMDEKGNVVTNFSGFKGDACYAAGKEIIERLKKLGVVVEIHEVTPHEPAPPIPEVVVPTEKQRVTSGED